MAADAARRQATYDDVLRAPEHIVAEVLNGDLYTSPRPAGPHAEAASVLGMDLGGAFHRGRITIISSQVSRLSPALSARWDRDRRFAAAWRALATLDARPLITHRLPFTDAQQAYELLDRSPAEALQVLLVH